MVPSWAWCSALSSLLLLCALELPWQGAWAGCPTVCSCSESNREVDCAWRGLRLLPPGLQHNMHALNLSHNRLSDLDLALAPFTHLRSLDLSHNRLGRLPAGLPRSLWELRASGNRLKILHKNDTAYQWNLRALDLSGNKLERVVFINNTLPALRALDISRNRFWTVPTNVPRGVQSVDLSHNTLVQILPGSLDHLTHLQKFYLHGNRFTAVSEGVFDRLTALRVVTLDENPWACDAAQNISYLLSWLRRTQASVLGCPCHTWHTCGENHLATTRGWHYASYTLAPQSPNVVVDHSNNHHGNNDDNNGGLGNRHHNNHRHNNNRRPIPPMRAFTAGYWPESALLDLHRPRETFGSETFGSSTQDYQSRWPPGGFYATSSPPPPQPPSDSLSTPDQGFSTQRFFTVSEYDGDDDEDSTETVLTTTTRRTTTLRTRSVNKGNQGTKGNVRSSSHRADAVVFSSVLALLISLLLAFAMAY